MLRKEGVRLVTLTGTAGTGKTRLAIKAAADLATSRTPSGWLYPDGVYFVSLAPVEDPGLVETTIARAVGVTETSGQSLHTSLIEYLGSKQLLLLLDNFEHLLPATPLVGELLAACPGIKAFVTSRATLNLRGEHEYPLPAMTVPGHDIPFQPEDLAQFESVALFIVRALEVLPSFSVTRDNARALAEICRRLDGLPLAIELAATRVKVLSPEAILSRLDRRMRLLVGGRLDMPSRQQALETAITWSYNLLDQESKVLYRGLSIFAGGFTLQAAEEILDGAHAEARPGQPPLSMLDGITSLVNKSLLVHSDQAPWAEDVRFTMLETLREYGLERLEESGEVESVSRRHALYFTTLSETALRELRGPRQVEWMHRIELEHDNMRAALRWAIKQEETEIALRLAGSLGRFWEIRGFLSEGRSWLRAALDLKAEQVSPYRALALYCLGSLAVRQRDYSTARPLLEESIGLYREQGDKSGLSNVLNTLAVMTVDSDYEEALALHEESLALRRELDDKTGIASSLHNIAFIKVHQGNWDEAYSLATELHTRWQHLGSTYGVSHVLYLLGLIATGQENYQVGERHLEECLELCAQVGDEWLAAWALHGLGELLYMQNKYDQANEVFARAEKLFAELGDELGRARTLISQGREAYRVTRYDEARRLFRQALQIGRKLDNHIVIGCCMAGFGALAGTRGELRLSARLFGCASDLLLTESTSLQRCAINLNMEDFRSALEATDPGEWQTIFDLGGLNRWEETAGITPDMSPV